MTLQLVIYKSLNFSVSISNFVDAYFTTHFDAQFVQQVARSLVRFQRRHVAAAAAAAAAVVGCRQ